MDKICAGERVELRRGLARGDHHAGTLLEQCASGSQSDSLRCTGDDSNTIGQLQIHEVPFLIVARPAR